MVYSSTAASRRIGIVVVAPRAAFAASTIAAVATIAALVAIVAVGLAHHRRGAFLVRLDADGEVAQHVFVEALLALDLVERRRRRVDVEQRHVRLAVLADAVGERLHAPIFGLGDLAAQLR